MRQSHRKNRGTSVQQKVLIHNVKQHRRNVFPTCRYTRRKFGTKQEIFVTGTLVTGTLYVSHHSGARLRSRFLACERSPGARLEVGDKSCRTQRSPRAGTAPERAAVGVVEPLVQQPPPVGHNFKRRRHAHQGVVAAGEMGRRTRPGPFFGSGHKARAHRIELDIACARQQMRLVHGHRRKTALPQLAAPTLAKIDAPRIAPMRIGKCCTQAARQLCAIKDRYSA